MFLVVYMLRNDRYTHWLFVPLFYMLVGKKLAASSQHLVSPPIKICGYE